MPEMNDTVQSWMERAGQNTGVLACGARLSDRSFVARSFSAQISEEQVAQAIRSLSDAAYALQQNRIAADRLRWTFENAQIRCISRPGGVLAALLLTPESANLPEIEQLLADFALTIS